MSKPNPKMKPPEVGDKVTSRYNKSDEFIVRTIIEVIRDDEFGSGYGVIADGGEPCGECGHVTGGLPLLDYGWFAPAKEKK